MEKHVIKSDSRAAFDELWNNLRQKLAEVGYDIVKVKMNFTNYNNDNSAYRPNYKAVVWAKKRLCADDAIQSIKKIICDGSLCAEAMVAEIGEVVK